MGTFFPNRFTASAHRHCAEAHAAWLRYAASLLIVMFIAVSSITTAPQRAHAADEKSPDFAAYDFTLKSLDGKTKVHLADLIAEKYVVVVFWAANCPICDFAMPYISTYNDFVIERKIKDVELVTVALDARSDDPLKRAVAERWAFEIVHDPMGRDTKAAYELEKMGIPACFIFNKHGYIIATLYGFDKKFTQNVQDAINADRQSQGGHSSAPNVIIEE
jgi:thiol-disulfide isomerase/thioredoxin